ncbi:MAG: GGDEF domain-containing phosphodiesterase [Sulfurimonas sp.]
MFKSGNLIGIDSFSLMSSNDITDVLRQIEYLKESRILVHVVSFIHNTVLVQTLIKELEKRFIDIKIVLLKHNDKNKTSLSIFSVSNSVDKEMMSDEILKELFVDRSSKDTTIKEYRNKLFHRYFTDHLTNLPNLYQLRKDLQNNEQLGLVLIKIDNFQIINNFYGFVVGDFVIEDVGCHLKKLLTEHQVYRLSGSEFALTIENHLGFYVLKKYLDELYLKLKNTTVSYQEIKISIDFTISSTANRDLSDIFSKVSMALKYAEDKGLPYWIYEERMNFENEYERNLQLSEIVREAIEESRIVPYYQAIIDNKTSKIVKYECLARLLDEHNKVLSPMLFIPVSKNIKMYNDITKIIIDKSFATFENSDFEFNVNLSIDDIMNHKMFDFIIEKLKVSKAASRVTFELLESELIRDFKKVERFINEVKRYGAKIAIDDFGSGYSNFSYLIKMKTDYIKIDGSLIENIDIDKQAVIVVETIVEFARKLGVKTVAEYVHSSVIMDKVKELGIDYSQGFYIDEPSLKPTLVS